MMFTGEVLTVIIGAFLIQILWMGVTGYLWRRLFSQWMWMEVLMLIPMVLACILSVIWWGYPSQLVFPLLAILLTWKIRRRDELPEHIRESIPLGVWIVLMAGAWFLEGWRWYRVVQEHGFLTDMAVYMQFAVGLPRYGENMNLHEALFSPSFQGAMLFHMLDVYLLSGVVYLAKALGVPPGELWKVMWIPAGIFMGWAVWAMERILALRISSVWVRMVLAWTVPALAFKNLEWSGWLKVFPGFWEGYIVAWADTSTNAFWFFRHDHYLEVAFGLWILYLLLNRAWIPALLFAHLFAFVRIYPAVEVGVLTGILLWIGKLYRDRRFWELVGVLTGIWILYLGWVWMLEPEHVVSGLELKKGIPRMIQRLGEGSAWKWVIHRFMQNFAWLGTWVFPSLVVGFVAGWFRTGNFRKFIQGSRIHAEIQNGFLAGGILVLVAGIAQVLSVFFQPVTEQAYSHFFYIQRWLVPLGMLLGTFLPIVWVGGALSFRHSVAVLGIGGLAFLFSGHWLFFWASRDSAREDFVRTVAEMAERVCPVLEGKRAGVFYAGERFPDFQPQGGEKRMWFPFFFVHLTNPYYVRFACPDVPITGLWHPLMELEWRGDTVLPSSSWELSRAYTYPSAILEVWVDSLMPPRAEYSLEEVAEFLANWIRRWNLSTVFAPVPDSLLLNALEKTGKSWDAVQVREELWMWVRPEGE